MAQLSVGDETYEFHALDAAAARLPYTLRILLENVLRNGGDADAVSDWVATAEPSREIAFYPARVLLQDFTGVPCVVDLAAMRNAMRDQGGDPEKINPLIPVELVIDHSVQVDEFASRLAIGRNVELEYERNVERYAFLRWGQSAFDNFKVVPPNTGIVHQVNLEYLARVVVCESVPMTVSGKATPSRTSTTRARYSRLTWWTMPVFGGTTLKLSNALWPQRRKA